jgi:TonB-dependent receptor
LEPFESTNFDIAFDWYYKDDSYFSIGYFRKDVKNFISRGRTELTFEGLRDIIAGPRAQQAIAELEAEGIQTTTDNIFDRIIANGGGTTIDGQPAIDQDANDPLVVWDIAQPVNNPEEQTVDGIEVAISHVIGETGFGFGLNATIVDSDSEFDINLLEPQQPLVGVSDSANAQVFYEKDGLSVKVTYAWRDDFLAGPGQQQGSADGPPTFVRDTGIVDFSINYDIDEHLTVFLEGYNVTNETEETYGRFESQFLEAAQFDVRYAFGARYTF